MGSYTIVVRTESQAQVACAYVLRNWARMAREEHPMAVHCYEYREHRSIQSQGLMWIRLGEIAKQVVFPDGQTFSAETWHIQAKKEFLPEEQGPSKRCQRGYQKWTYCPDGSRELIGSTTQLTTLGMNEYLTQLEAWAAEMGVRMSANPRIFDGEFGRD